MKPILAVLETPANPFATVWTYLAYLGISVALTIWVARTLHKNGRIFLVEKPRVIVGRGDADVVLNDTEVSRQHAAIELRDGNSLSRRTGGTTNNQPKVAKCDRSSLRR